MPLAWRLLFELSQCRSGPRWQDALILQCGGRFYVPVGEFGERLRPWNKSDECAKRSGQGMKVKLKEKTHVIHRDVVRDWVNSLLKEKGDELTLGGSFYLYITNDGDLAIVTKDDNE